MYDFSIEKIRNSFGNAARALEGVEGMEDTYLILKELSIEQLTPIEMLQKFSQISNYSSYGPVLSDFFYKASEELKVLAQQEVKKQELTEELKQKHKEFQTEVVKKGLDYNTDVEGLNFNYGDDARFNTMSATNDDIQNDINLLDKRIENLNQKRKTGDSLEEIPTETYNEVRGISEGYYDRPNNTIKNMNSEFEKINTQVQKTNYYNNPTLEEMAMIYNSISDKQNEDALLNVDIRYDNDKVKVFLTLEGTGIDETLGKTECHFSDLESFNREVLPYLVSVHANGGIKEEATLEKGDLESYNLYDEKLTISGDDEISLETADKLNEAMKERKKTTVQKVRTLDNNGNNKIMIYSSLIALTILIAIVTYLYIVLFN